MESAQDQRRSRECHHQMVKFIDSMDGLGWVTHLDEDDLDSMLNDVAKALKKNKRAERRIQIVYVLYDWKATAEVQADPELRRRLTEPIANPTGERVPIPAG